MSTIPGPPMCVQAAVQGGLATAKGRTPCPDPPTPPPDPPARVAGPGCPRTNTTGSTSTGVSVGASKKAITGKLNSNGTAHATSARDGNVHGEQQHKRRRWAATRSTT